MRVERIGDAVLYLGDCLEILPTLGKVSAVVTDPVWPNAPRDLLPGADDPWRLFADSWNVMPSATRVVIVMRHDSDPRFLNPIPAGYVRAVWLPYVMPGYIGRLLGGDEIGYCFGTPIPSRPGQRVIPGRANPVQPGGRKANGHPCSRAIEHFNFLIRWWSEPTEMVLDPFMGTGTTGVACANLGRKFTGIEIEEKYFDIACRRIEAAYKQPRLFEDEPAPLPGQAEMDYHTEP